MKKIKIALGIIVVAFVALFIYQNFSFFMQKQGFDLNLYFDKYQTPPCPIGILFLGCLIIGFLVSFFMNLMYRFKTRKNIKNLNSVVDSHVEVISELKNELKASKGQTVIHQPEVVETTVS
ncbi:MAG: hypothetical protein PHP23_01225 [Desulfobacterales bacterium]|nr:hypothetical protein [Desulfobacterales bacterium]MDD4071175.1 hypothetical protein [Desulfobacterales bacterium]MDD4393359.1 hypothetical protein [Desulfobacterales bacterium]